MAEGSLVPAFVEINYHSAYAPHKMTIPTLNWNPGGTAGDFETWAAGTIPADDMVEELIDLMKVFFPATVTFDSYIIYTKAAVEDPSIPRYAKSIAVVGTNATPGNSKAVQATWTVKCTDGSVAKIVMLDVGNNNSFVKVTQATVGADGLAFLAAWFASTNGWSGRKNFQPYFYLQTAYTLNEALRRQYHEN
jgi:hypothetical protein